MESSIREAETRAGHEGEDTALKGKLIIIRETVWKSGFNVCSVKSHSHTQGGFSFR